MSRQHGAHGEQFANYPTDVPLIIELRWLALNRCRLHEIVRQGTPRS